MGLGFLFELLGVTHEQYDAIMQHLGLAGPNANWPSGLICHIAGPMEGGWRVVDVWDSQEAAGTFFRERLAQAAQTAGISPPQPKVFPIHNLHIASR